MQQLELLVMKDDIAPVLEYLGNRGNFQFDDDSILGGEKVPSRCADIFSGLQDAAAYLKVSEPEALLPGSTSPTETDFAAAVSLIAASTAVKEKELAADAEHKRIAAAHQEALAFANLKAPFVDIDKLSFLTMRIGTIDETKLDELRGAVGEAGVVVHVGNEPGRILAVSSKKAHVALDTALKTAHFVATEIAKDFRGIPEGVLENLAEQAAASGEAVSAAAREWGAFADAHREALQRLLCTFSVGTQVETIRRRLEGSALVHRLVGWIPAQDSSAVVREIDDLTAGRIAIRLYHPTEIPAVLDNTSEVPVKLTHGRLLTSFSHVITAYGIPKYGTIDPSPFVAFFFTILFGLMFGDAGQGLVFLLTGIVLTRGIFKKAALFRNWAKFGPACTAIGCSSTVMGLLNGEFFGNETLLRPFGEFVTGFFGTPREHVLGLFPSGEGAVAKVAYFFLFTILFGFVINSVGLGINIINNFSLKHYTKAFFGKIGLVSAVFFWYVMVMVVRIAAFHHPIDTIDWVVIGVTLAGVFASEPLERLVEGHRPLCPGGVTSAIIGGIVEILEVATSYFSNSLSFLRVGAFALAHAVLGFIIFSTADLVGGIGSAGGIAIAVFGNAIVLVLEGMIVIIQTIRLQYYEFFSKFFNETGRAFVPFKFIYKV
jgi:V/A-type H+-transporting ATPase subunit I